MATGSKHSRGDKFVGQADGTRVTTRGDNLNDIVAGNGDIWVQLLGRVVAGVVDDEFVV